MCQNSLATEALARALKYLLVQSTYLSAKFLAKIEETRNVCVKYEDILHLILRTCTLPTSLLGKPARVSLTACC